jgi:hypothetical protein
VSIADAAPESHVARRLLIDGRLVGADKTFPSINPATTGGKRLARRIRTGSFSINGGNYFGADTPFGGFKQSGVGREMGAAGLEEFLESKTFAVPAVSAEGAGA